MKTNRFFTLLRLRISFLNVAMVLHLAVCFWFLILFWLPLKNVKDWNFIKIQLLIALGFLGLWLDGKLRESISDRAICNVSGALITILILVWSTLLFHL
jgi:hypothetical protein